MNKYQRHRQICEKMNDTYRRKNFNYKDSFGRTVQNYGPISALTRLSDKWQRFEALILGAENTLVDETLMDTAIDMANYLIITVIELEIRDGAVIPTDDDYVKGFDPYLGDHTVACAPRRLDDVTLPKLKLTIPGEESTGDSSPLDMLKRYGPYHSSNTRTI